MKSRGDIFTTNSFVSYIFSQSNDTTVNHTSSNAAGIFSTVRSERFRSRRQANEAIGRY
jgi:hypothetical protein